MDILKIKNKMYRLKNSRDELHSKIEMTEEK